MSSITGIVRMHLRNRLSWFFTPAMMLCISFVITLFIGLLIGGDATTYSGAIASIYIYMFILGIITLRETFPLALGFSVRRTDYFLGTLVTIVAVSAAWAIALLLLAFIENGLTRGWGIGLHFFYLPYVSDGPFGRPLGIYFVVLLHMYVLGFVIGSIFQRFGRAGMYVFFTIVFLLCSVGTVILTYFRWWGRLFGSLAGQSAFTIALWLVPLIAVYAFISYLLLRKATV